VVTRNLKDVRRFGVAMLDQFFVDQVQIGMLRLGLV
jgi:hypothetical protein